MNSTGSKEQLYKEYVQTHIENVQKAYAWLKRNLPEVISLANEETLERNIKNHDKSKFSPEEFGPYAEHWYGNRTDEAGYQNAWKHHYMTNKHHPEYWQGKNIPYTYIVELICDWFSFGYKKHDIMDIVNYWNNRKNTYENDQLSPATKQMIDKIIKKIEDKILDNRAKRQKNLKEDIDC